MLKPLLIEIGVEELPAIPFLKELSNIEKKWSDILEKNSLLCNFELFYTPRRLVLWHREFQVKQEDSEVENIGRNLHDSVGNTLATALGYLNLKIVDVDMMEKLLRQRR